MTRLLDRIFAPQWAGGWAAARVALALGLLFAHIPRFRFIEDAYAASDMVFSKAPFHLADYIVWTPPTAYGLWGAGIAGALLLLWGGRLAKPGLLLFLITAGLLLVAEAFNIKAYDRVMLWMSIGLLLGPIGERDLVDKERSPVGRYWLLLFYGFLYLSTGYWKAVQDDLMWFTGDVLAYHLVDNWFGGSALGAWISGQRWLYLPMQWFTIVFELAFPFAILWRRTNVAILVMGVLLHLGIWSTMNVGPFSFVALCGYPVLLHPDIARRWWARFSGWRSARAAAA